MCLYYTKTLQEEYETTIDRDVVYNNPWTRFDCLFSQLVKNQQALQASPQLHGRDHGRRISFCSGVALVIITGVHQTFLSLPKSKVERNGIEYLC